MTPKLLAFLFLCLTFDLAYGYSSGAPERPAVCENMEPPHGNQPQEDNPYRIDIRYTPENGIEVFLTGYKPFRGILLEARSTDPNDQQSYGTFHVRSTQHVKTMNCGEGRDNAVTHSSSDEKSDVVIPWSPPDRDVGELRFVATFLESKLTWWRNTKSPVIPYRSANSASSNIVASSVTSAIVSIILLILV